MVSLRAGSCAANLFDVSVAILLDLLSAFVLEVINVRECDAM